MKAGALLAGLALWATLPCGCQGPPRELAQYLRVDAGGAADADAAAIDPDAGPVADADARSIDADADRAAAADPGSIDADSGRAVGVDAGAVDAGRSAHTDAGAIDAAGGIGQPRRDYTVVVLPDTQFYASTYPAIFDAQTRWIADQRMQENIAFVVHEGDLVDSDDDAQWTAAAHSMSQLDGVVPYVVSMGNHDYGPAGDGWTMSRSTTIDTYFPVSKFAESSWFQGTFDPQHIENNYALIDSPDGPWLVISLEFGPRDGVLDWANDILRAYPTTQAMVVTHAYLYEDNTRYDHIGRPDQRWNPHSYPIDMTAGAVNDGEEIWQKLILGHSNIQFVLCGHVIDHGTGRLISARTDGTNVIQLLANYQMLSLGGGGFLRLMHFSPATRSVHVQTYSPYFDLFNTDDANDFTLAY
jgi:Calcineurin-like phosphoesterase